MPWINDTPHSQHDKEIEGPGSGAKKAALRLKAKRKAEAKAERDRLKAEGIKPKRKPTAMEAATKRLRGGEKILFTRPAKYTWEATGRTVANGVLTSLKQGGVLVELDAGLFPGEPGQTWGCVDAAQD